MNKVFRAKELSQSKSMNELFPDTGAKPLIDYWAHKGAENTPPELD